MAVIEIKTYKCSDGKTFEVRDEADVHELILSLEQFIRSHRRFVGQEPDDDDKYCKMIAHLLYDHQEALATLLGWREE